MAHFDTVIATHLRGVVLGMKYAAPAMIRQGSGSIINTGSIAGLRAGYSAHSYSAAKAAVIHVTRCVAAELGEKGIRVNSISPGAIVTGIFAKGAGLPDAVAERTADGLKERFAAFQPMPARRPARRYRAGRALSGERRRQLRQRPGPGGRRRRRRRQPLVATAQDARGHGGGDEGAGGLGESAAKALLAYARACRASNRRMRSD